MVLVVEDEPQVSAAVSRTLVAEGLDVVVTADLAHGLEVASLSEPDLVVLDLGLPDGDGLELLTTLRTWSSVPILILSGSPDEQRRVEALRRGADDFLVKPFAPAELVARLGALTRRVAEGWSRPPTPQSLAFAGLEVDLVDRAVRREGRTVRLTPTEWRILIALVTHPRKLLTHAWLAQEVWGDTYGSESTGSQRAHLRSLRAKIGDDARAPRLIETVRSMGYRWIAEPTTRESPHAAALELVHDANNALAAAGLLAGMIQERLAPEDETLATQLTEALETIEHVVDSLVDHGSSDGPEGD